MKKCPDCDVVLVGGVCERCGGILSDGKMVFICQRCKSITKKLYGLFVPCLCKSCFDEEKFKQKKRDAVCSICGKPYIECCC